MSTHDPASLLAEGETRLAANDWDGAATVFRQAVAVAPSSAIAHSKLGVALARMTRWEEAVAEFARAIQLDPRYAPAYSNLGNVYHECGRLDEAVASYQNAIALDPEYGIAHQNLGIVYKQQGKVAEAVREFKTATRLSLRSSHPRAAQVGPAAGGRRRLGCLGTVILALFAVGGILWL